MKNIILHDGEYKFMKLVWSNEPINSTELVKLSLEKLGWKKSTVYTTIKRLAQKELLVNDNAIVRSLISEDDVARTQTMDSIDQFYDGSIQRFFASFLKHEKLSKDEIQSLRSLIEDQLKEE